MHTNTCEKSEKSEESLFSTVWPGQKGGQNLRRKGRTESERRKIPPHFLPPFFGLFSGFFLSLSISLYLYIYLYYTEKRTPLIRFLRKNPQPKTLILEGATVWWGRNA